jgi:hypothetical protein
MERLGARVEQGALVASAYAILANWQDPELKGQAEP